MIEIKLVEDEGLLDQCAQVMCSSDPFVTLKFDFNRCRLSLTGSIKEVYAAYYEGEFAGFIVLQFGGFMRGYIQTICLKPEYRGRGIGTAMLEFSEERLFRFFPNVYICVSSFNHGAQKLYYQLGFEKIGELKDYFLKGYDEYILRKTVGPFAEYSPMEVL